MRIFIMSVLCLFCFLNQAWANDLASLQARVQELSQMVQDLRGVVERQQQEIVLLKEERQPPAVGLAQSPPGVTRTTGRWNPDIGVVADTVLKLDSPKEDAEGADRVSVRELELVLGSAVDPYSRLDVTLSFSDFEEVSLEEAYYTHFGLPLEITARIGKFKPHIGKSIPVHRDGLDTVDEPLVIQRYFGAEGYNKSGIDIRKPIDLPFGWTHEAALGVLEGGNGEGGTLFGETRRRPTLYAHLKNYTDINEATGLEWGASYLVGSRDEDRSFETNVIGVDSTLIHRYADQRQVKLQAEAFRVSRQESFYERESAGAIFLEDLDDARHLWGSYVLLDWRFHPQWAMGFRFDDVQLIETGDNFANPQQTERGYTGYVTFYQSEFARFRAQLTHRDLTSDQDDNQVLIQGTFAIGEHKHKLQ